jgi:hypothetical protein
MTGMMTGMRQLTDAVATSAPAVRRHLRSFSTQDQDRPLVHHIRTTACAGRAAEMVALHLGAADVLQLIELLLRLDPLGGRYVEALGGPRPAHDRAWLVRAENYAAGGIMRRGKRVGPIQCPAW